MSARGVWCQIILPEGRTSGKAAKVVLDTRPALLQLLQELQHDKTVQPIAKAKAKKFEKDLNNFKQIFGLTVFYEILCIFEDLSRNFQRRDLTAELAIFCKKRVDVRMQQLRSDEEFERLYSKVQALKLDNDTDDLATRKRKIPKYLDNTDTIVDANTSIWDANRNTANKAELKRLYVEVIDCTTQCVETRFQSDGLATLKLVENILISASNGRNDETRKDSIIKIEKQFQALDLTALSSNLDELHLLLRMYNSNRADSQKIKEVTSVSTVAELLNDQPVSKKCIAAVDQLLRLYLTVPLASAPAERTFSAMRRLKSWIRANTAANHLNNIMFANLHKEDMDLVNIDNVAREFALKNGQRQAFFGTQS